MLGNYIVKLVDGALSVTPRPIIVIADAKTKILGEVDPALTFTLAPGSSLVNGDVFSGGLVRVAGEGVGFYDIQQGTLALSSNYALSFTPALFNIRYASGSCLGSPGRTILQPINSDRSSVFKQGSVVPAKFRVCDSLGRSIGTAGVVKSFTLLSSSSTPSLSVNEAIVSATPDTAFRWSSSDEQWIFNLSTKNLRAGATYTYRVTLNDGTFFDFGFGLR